MPHLLQKVAPAGSEAPQLMQNFPAAGMAGGANGGATGAATDGCAGLGAARLILLTTRTIPATMINPMPE
jgi:hypothetical protein